MPCCPRGSKIAATEKIEVMGQQMNKVVPHREPETVQDGNNSERKEKPSWPNVICIFLACALPSIVAVACYSLIGVGLELYNTIAEKQTNTYGNCLGAVLFMWLCGMFVLDWQRQPNWVRLPTGTVFVVGVIGAAVLKSTTYPWFPVLFTLVCGPAALLYMRSTKEYSRKSFYKVVGVTAIVWTCILALAFGIWTFTTDYSSNGAQWTVQTKNQLIQDSARIYKHIYDVRALDYAADCGPAAVTNTDAIVQASVDTACLAANTVWFVIWMVPLAAALFNFIVACFCFLDSRFELDNGKAVQNLLQQFVCLLVFLITGMYCSIYASGASVQLASAFMAFFAAAMTGLVLYTYFEVPLQFVGGEDTGMLMMYLKKAYRSDWIRAILVGGVNVLIPIMFVLYVIRTKVRKWKGTGGNEDPGQSSPGFVLDGDQQEQPKPTSFVQQASFTQPGSPASKNNVDPAHELFQELKNWNWCSIFVKVNILGEIFFMVILGGKFTYMLFSWLNEQLLLAGVELAAVSILVFLVGCCMFLLPPVPGSAVYLFAGIVIGTQAERSIGFWPGVVFASLVGLVAKLCACIGQYGIGYAAGKSVQVQKTIGVDTVPTRAIEQILRQRGLQLGKVAILVGGPDWPTSVTCGILRLNIPQMLLGTLPVYLASIAPQTLVGALLSKDSEGDPNASLWNIIKTVATGLAAVAQAAASLIAAYSITQTIEKDGTELAKPRAEHEQVAQLTAQQANYNKALKRVCQWNPSEDGIQGLSNCRKAVILGSAVLQLVSGFIVASDFVLMEPMSYRKFSITDSLGDKHGLNGNPLAIVRVPVGVISVSVFGIAVLLHIIHVKDMAGAARRDMEARSDT